MRMVPPPGADWSAQRTPEHVQAHQTSIGATLVTFFWSFWVTWAAPIVLYIRRIERAPCSPGRRRQRRRRRRSADITQALHDLGWILFVTVIWSLWVQLLAIGAAILIDRNPEPALPRWLGYPQLWVASSSCLPGWCCSYTTDRSPGTA
jgi:hypothetical protein